MLPSIFTHMDSMVFFGLASLAAAFAFSLAGLARQTAKSLARGK